MFSFPTKSSTLYLIKITTMVFLIVCALPSARAFARNGPLVESQYMTIDIGGEKTIKIRQPDFAVRDFQKNLRTNLKSRSPVNCLEDRSMQCYNLRRPVGSADGRAYQILATPRSYLLAEIEATLSSDYSNRKSKDPEARKKTALIGSNWGSFDRSGLLDLKQPFSEGEWVSMEPVENVFGGENALRIYRRLVETTHSAVCGRQDSNELIICRGYLNAVLRRGEKAIVRCENFTRGLGLDGFFDNCEVVAFQESSGSWLVEAHISLQAIDGGFGAGSEETICIFPRSFQAARAKNILIGVLSQKPFDFQIRQDSVLFAGLNLGSKSWIAPLVNIGEYYENLKISGNSSRDEENSGFTRVSMTGDPGGGQARGGGGDGVRAAAGVAGEQGDGAGGGAGGVPAGGDGAGCGAAIANRGLIAFFAVYSIAPEPESRPPEPHRLFGGASRRRWNRACLSSGIDSHLDLYNILRFIRLRSVSL